MQCQRRSIWIISKSDLIQRFQFPANNCNLEAWNWHLCFGPVFNVWRGKFLFIDLKWRLMKQMFTNDTFCHCASYVSFWPVPHDPHGQNKIFFFNFIIPFGTCQASVVNNYDFVFGYVNGPGKSLKVIFLSSECSFLPK